jgi:hypothetical protein
MVHVVTVGIDFKAARPSQEDVREEATIPGLATR